MKGLLGLGANIHQRFLASALEIEKPVSLQKLSLTETEMTLPKSSGLLLKSVQGSKRSGIVWVVSATELHNRGMIALCP